MQYEKALEQPLTDTDNRSTMKFTTTTSAKIKNCEHD